MDDNMAEATREYQYDLGLANQELTALIPEDACFILLDQECWRGKLTRRDQAMPFTQCGGVYWGPPPDDRTAIEEFEALRRSGAAFAVVGAPAFWWLDYYHGFRDHLSTNYPCVFKNERMIVFDLRNSAQALTETCDSKRCFEVEINHIRVHFSLKDAYSRRWFHKAGDVYERPVTEMLLHFLRDARCFVDVGANLGWYTCLASKHMVRGRVFAFEMDRLNQELLAENIRLNRCANVEAVWAAVTDGPGLVSYRRDQEAPSTMHRMVENDADGVLRVQGITLDGFFEERGILPDVIKIDVEGAEALVLHGMLRLLRKGSPALFMEVHPYHLPQFGSSAAELIELLQGRDYGVYEIPEIRGQESVQILRQVDPLHPPGENAMWLAVRGDLPEWMQQFSHR